MWDWDEALYACAVREFNVGLHHPHPPGFPLFIAVSKVVHWFVPDAFHSLRAVSLVASLFVFPALYGFARAFRFPFATSIVAAVIFSFLPNVWFWGGTAFSDIFAVVLFLGSGAFLMRDRRRRSYIIGCVLFAATMLVRPQNVLLAYPWLVASRRRLRRRRIAEVMIGAAVVVILVIGGYALAAKATGWSNYIRATKEHGAYVAKVDGSLNPNRPPLLTLFRDFVIDPFLAGPLSTLLFSLILLALIRIRRRDVAVFATFAPSLLLSWLMLNPTGASRLSLGYIPMHALLAADGIAIIADLLTRRLPPATRARAAMVVQARCALLLAAAYFGWTWPAVREVWHYDSPPAAAMKWVRDSLPRDSSKIVIEGGMVPFADYYLSGWNVVRLENETQPEDLPAEANAFYIASSELRAVDAINFRRPRGHLYGLSHRRYFEAAVAPVGASVQLLDGWYKEEFDERESWRWTARRARMSLSPLPGRGKLELRVMAPLDVEPAPLMAVVVDGSVIDRFVPNAREFRRQYIIHSEGMAHEVIIDLSRTINPSGAHLTDDPRDLGLKFHSILWGAIN